MRIAPRVLLLPCFALPLLVGAGPTGETTVDAVVDRLEEELVVLDVAPHASLAIPWGSTELSEGEAVTLSLAIGGTAEVPRSDTEEWRVIAADESRIRLAGGDPERLFGWPRALAPPVEAGDRLHVRIRPDRARTARLRRELEALQRTLPEP